MNYKLWTGETGDLHIKLWTAINEYAKLTDDNKTSSVMKIEDLIALIVEKQVENSFNELSDMYKAATTEQKHEVSQGIFEHFEEQRSMRRQTKEIEAATTEDKRKDCERRKSYIKNQVICAQKNLDEAYQGTHKTSILVDDDVEHPNLFYCITASNNDTDDQKEKLEQVFDKPKTWFDKLIDFFI